MVKQICKKKLKKIRLMYNSVFRYCARRSWP